jgi:hypothetical protein
LKTFNPPGFYLTAIQIDKMCQQGGERGKILPGKLLASLFCLGRITREIIVKQKQTKII